MVAETQLYDVLMVPVTASTEEISKSYRKMALKYHPDKTNHDPALTEKFKDMTKAYEVLKDAHQRKIYDAYGHAGLDGSLAEKQESQRRQAQNGYKQGQASYKQGQNGPKPSGFPGAFGGADFLGGSFGMGDLGIQQAMFSQFFSNVNQVFGNFQEPQQNMARHVQPLARDPARQRGANIHHTFQVSLGDMYHGKVAKFQLPRMTKCAHCKGFGCFHPKTCATCQGSGKVMVTMANQFSKFQEVSSCTSCSGTGIYHNKKDVCTHCEAGFSVQKKILPVTIPPGARNGDKCVLPGQSDEGPHIVPGDVVIHVQEQPHPYLVRKGNDLFMERDIDLKTALLGGKVVIGDFPRTGEDLIVFINVHGDKSLNDSIHGMVGTGQVVGTISPGHPKVVKGLGMPINPAIRNGKYTDTGNDHFDSCTLKRGDLYIRFNVHMPQVADFGPGGLQALASILPGTCQEESFGTVAWEHHLSNLPGEERGGKEKESSKVIESDGNGSDGNGNRRINIGEVDGIDEVGSDGIDGSDGLDIGSGDDIDKANYDYSQLDVDSQASEEHEDDEFYAQEWSKEKRRKTE